MANTRKVKALVSGLDEQVRVAGLHRDKLTIQLERAQYRYEALIDCREIVTDILTALDEPEEPPF